MQTDNFFQRRGTEGQQVHEGSASVVIQTRQIKTTVRCHFTLVRVTIVKKTRNKC